jgi:hypothetical protein
MTLVLAACLEDSVILGADSWIFRRTPLGDLEHSGVDRKIFKFEEAGVATFSGDPFSYSRRVPTEIDDHIPKNLRPEEICKAMQRHFATAIGLNALVGGFDDSGKAALHELRIPGDVQRIARSGDKPPQLFYRGFANSNMECSVPTRIGVIEQMLDLLRAHSGKWAGPPYEFVVIEPQTRVPS